MKKDIAEYFNIDELFVNISKTNSFPNKRAYQVEIKFETREHDLKTFNLAVYSFNITPLDKDCFIYETVYYNYDRPKPFLKIIDQEVKELNKN